MVTYARIQRTAFENPSSPEEWLEAVEMAEFRIVEAVRYLKRREVAVCVARQTGILADGSRRAAHGSRVSKP